MGHRKKFGTIVQIGDILVSEDVILEYFACDYPVCRGKCCIVGDSGAPLLEEELDPIEANYDVFSPLMREEGRQAVREKGFFEIDRDGDLVTPLVPGSEECAFCHFEDGNCLCSIERQFFAGKSTFRKPISCQLYPVRAVRMRNGTIGLNLHRWDICACAFEKGRREGIRAYEFLKDPLTEAYGADFYEALCVATKQVIAESS
ncbi:MAG: DUF3109 family protein [Bacteroidales bacterium]|nr:DUF3109 family protein [Bacteroidales bacterium]